MYTLPRTLPAFFWHFIRKYPWSYALFFLAPVTLVLEMNVMPYALKMIIDALTRFNGNRAGIWDMIAPALWLYGGCWLVMVVVLRFQNWWQGTIIPKYQADIRLSVMEYLTLHSHHYFSNQLSGSLANKVNDLPRALDSMRMIICWNIIAATSISLAALIMMATINLRYSAILATWIIVHTALCVWFARNTYHASAENAEDKSALSGAIVDTLSNITSVKLFARNRYEIGYIGTRQEKERKSNKRLILAMNWLRLWMDIPVTFMVAGFFFVLIHDWQQGNVTIGTMVFILTSALGVVYQMWFMGHALADLFREIGVAKQALAIISVPHTLNDAPDATALQVTEGRIAFEQVSFNYVRNNNLFHNKDVVIAAGSKVGLVGFSGSGKTTFVNLILRFFDVAAGRITIDGQDIAGVTQDSLREQISMIPQDTTLFHRSLMENIRYGRLDASDEEVIEAAKKAHCHAFISELSEGYNTLVGERGIKLSGGQRQRIAIARAILKNAKILILDEATSALDSVTEQQIQESLEGLMQQATTIVIAHRLSTLAAMDRILVFNKGQIIEDGSHAELLTANGHYAHMWRCQAGGFLPEKEEG